MEPKREKQADMVDLVLSSSNGRPAPSDATYCAFCGTELEGGEAAAKRFGEPFCSAAHAEAFAAEVRAARTAAAAARPTGEPGDDAGQTAAGGEGQWGLGRLLKLAACCGIPILAVVLLAGGGAALLGAGAAALPYLALLACPLGMFFMMRGMQHHGSDDAQRGQDQAKASTADRGTLRGRRPDARSLRD
jgi:hypothetical protein